jgi:hypothetical protein
LPEGDPVHGQLVAGPVASPAHVVVDHRPAWLAIELSCAALKASRYAYGWSWVYSCAYPSAIIISPKLRLPEPHVCTESQPSSADLLDRRERFVRAPRGRPLPFPSGVASAGADTE